MIKRLILTVVLLAAVVGATYGQQTAGTPDYDKNGAKAGFSALHPPKPVSPSDSDQLRIVTAHNAMLKLQIDYDRISAQMDQLQKLAADTKVRFEEAQKALLKAIEEAKAKLPKPPDGKQWTMRDKDSGGVEFVLADVPKQTEKEKK